MIIIDNYMIIGSFKDSTYLSVSYFEAFGDSGAGTDSIF